MLRKTENANAAGRPWSLSFGWLWSPHGSELQWEAFVVGEISIKIVRATKASRTPPPPEKEAENLP